MTGGQVALVARFGKEVAPLGVDQTGTGKMVNSG